MIFDWAYFTLEIFKVKDVTEMLSKYQVEGSYGGSIRMKIEK